MAKIVECRQVEGKTIRSLNIYPDGDYGPELQIDFSDGTGFNFVVGNQPNIEASFLLETPSGPETLHSYTAACADEDRSALRILKR